MLGGSEPVVAYLAEKLTTSSRVVIKIVMRSTTVRAIDRRIDLRIDTSANRFDGFAEQE